MVLLPHPCQEGRLGRRWACGVLWGFAFVGLMAAEPPRRLRVGCDRDYPPYEYVDAQGRPAGFNVELAQAIGRELGMEVEVRAGDWSAIRAAFARGELDVLSGLLQSEQRSRDAAFSVPHSVLSYALFVRKGGPQPEGVAALGGLRVLTQKGDFAFEHLKAEGRHVEGLATPADALRSLARGEGDCAVVPKAIGLFILQRERIPNVRPQGAPFLPRKYSLAVHPDQFDLLSRINEALFVLKEDGRHHALVERHFGQLEAAPITLAILLRKGAIVLVPGLGLLQATAAWSWTLRRRVAQRTQALAQELAERLRIEASLRQSESRFRLLAEQSHDLICEVDEQGRYCYVNPVFETALGYPSEALVGSSMAELGLADEADLARLRAMWPGLSQPGSRGAFEFRIRDAQGAWHWMDSRSSCYLDPQDQLRVGLISRDMTERRQAEEALRQSQKLESLGLLAGGIAHDFNNLLTALLANLNLARERLARDHAIQAPLAVAEGVVLKAAGLTRQMLAYAGRGRCAVEVLDLNALLREMRQFLEASLPKKVRMELTLDSRLPVLRADAAQLQQVVLNLLTNAAEAIGDLPGTIRIRTQAAELEPSETEQRFPGQGVVPGRFAVLEVADEGCGMSEAVRARIFDPFFTTKPTGRGLGLSALRGILKGHGAGLEVESAPGRGSTFRIHFPAITETDAPVPSIHSSPSTGRGGRVLLVDDEAAIREAVAAALQSQGMEVVLAEDGVEALQKLEGVDLVLLDRTMPRMDGLETLRILRQRAPELPVILSSGYSEQEQIPDMPGAPPGFLPKPYNLRELRQKVQEALGAISNPR